MDIEQTGRLARSTSAVAADARRSSPARAVRLRRTAVAVAFVLGIAGSAGAFGAELSCRLDFTMKGWSAIYKTATGSGTVTCTNGASMKVTLASKGFGLTAGKSTIDVGKGAITGLKDINDVLGSYAAADASAGAMKASSAAVLTKGEVSLALSGTGRGWDLGVSFSDFTISR